MEIQSLQNFPKTGKRYCYKESFLILILPHFQFECSMEKPEKLEFDEKQIKALLDRIEYQKLESDDYPLFADLIRSFGWISKELEEKNLTIRLLRRIFGFKTERTSLLENLQNSESESSEGDPETDGKGDEKDKDKGKKRSGKRWSAKDYKNAIVNKIAHHSLKKGDRCPDCKSGNLRIIDPGKVLRIVGQPWLQALIYERERLRCNTCGKTFTAKLPEDLARASKYDKTAKAIVCLLKYRGGFPFYRQQNLQKMLETPISDSVLWEMTKDVAMCLEPAYNSLIEEASKGDCIHNDDTKARVLDLIKENKNQKDDKARTGIYTSAILSRFPDKQIGLFFTGRQHAGENLNEVLDNRPKDMPTPTQMCDASSNNRPKDHETDEANCLAHLRRKFYEIAGIWPTYALPIISFQNAIFRHDRMAKEKELDDEARLKWHQKMSGPVMKDLKKFCKSLIDDKKTEPNSNLGKAIAYMNNHWKGFTLFLRKLGVPLDNNSDERLMKQAVLNRKNGLFFKSVNGALIGDILLSMIETCQLNDINPYPYLIAVQTYKEEIEKNPSQWLPWNYQETMTS
ncbi:MAG: hypothetical protein K940chlam3_01651 [Chlamydiae bacterium]|nr:hypothetical protein [Chlamydiota bacterium]